MFTISNGIYASVLLSMKVTDEAENNRATLATDGVKELFIEIL